MKTKEAVQFCKTLKSLKIVDSGNGQITTISKEILDDIIGLLQQHEQMWKDLKNNFPYLRGRLEVKEFIEEFEKKYFPKEK